MNRDLAQAPPPTAGGRLPPAQSAAPAPAAAAAEAHGPPLPVWTCEFVPATVPHAGQLDNLTVGALFQLNCQGDIAVAWTDGLPMVQFPAKEQAYTLYILQTLKLEPQRAELLVTGYKSGDNAPEYVRIVQGAQGFETLKPKWAIKSVLKPNEQTPPYPPFGPWNLSLPLWFWLALAAVILAVIYFSVRTVRRYNQRSRMLADLQRHKTALSPLHQYYKDTRNIRRRLHTVKQVEELNAISEELNREFRLYVLRQFQIPTLDWSDREIVRDLRKRHSKIYYRVREPLRKTLRELGRMAGQKQILFKDVEQMQRMSLDTVERIEKAREGSHR